MAKVQGRKRRSNRGRDMRHTETQAQLDVNRKERGKAGSTDGTYKVAMSAASPGLNRRKPRTKSTAAYLTRADIENGEKGRENYPDLLHVDKRGRVHMRTYYREV